MIRNDEIQTAFISTTKGNANIVALLTTSEEIREDQWQGNEFVYPNIRIRMVSNSPMDADCRQQFTVSFMVFTEDASSEKADKIAGIIAGELHNKAFVANLLKISLFTTNLLPAIRSDIRTWRSEALFQGIVSRSS